MADRADARASCAHASRGAFARGRPTDGTGCTMLLLEQLELRRMMSVTADLSMGVLTVTSDGEGDEIFVSVEDPPMGGPRVVVEDYAALGSEFFDFPLNSVDEIRVF